MGVGHVVVPDPVDGYMALLGDVSDCGVLGVVVVFGGQLFDECCQVDQLVIELCGECWVMLDDVVPPVE